MNALTDAILELLHEHPLVTSIRIVNLDETPAGKIELKIRCRFADTYQIQIWLHHESTFQDYAYQLFTDRPILRWDNAPHYPHIPTAPHHFHGEDEAVTDSPLTGGPIADLK
jgi:hypothetical protein